jgi:DnaK suppressor protein
MDEEKWQRYRELLLKRQHEILNDIKGKEEDVEGLQQLGSSDPFDKASDSRTLELLMTIGDAERREFEEIEHALRKIEEGTYGICEQCNSPIGEARLEAIPTARLCRPCKENEEKSGIIRPVTNYYIRRQLHLREELEDGVIELEQEDFDDFDDR